jgi:hypothetical protein
MIIQGWKADHILTDAQAAKLQDQILELLTDRYTLPDGREVHGNSFSWVVKELRQRFGWRNLGSASYDFENLFKALDFIVVRDARNRRGGRAEIVTL